MFLLDNPHFRGFTAANLRWMFTAFLGGHYQPLTWLSYAFDYSFSGLDPAGYHATSLLIHSLNAALFFLVARLLLDAARPGDNTGAAAGAALLFSLHPLRVESVAWAADRRDVLAGFFYLLALWAYLRARVQGEGRLLWLAGSCAAFALSLLSKAIGITFPLVLLVVDWYPLRRLGKRAVVEKIPFLLLSLGAAAQAAAAQGGIDTVRPVRDYAVAERLSQAAYGLAFYLGKTIVPAGISPLYEIPAHWDPLAPRFVLSAALAALVSALAFRLRRRFPPLLAVWSCYALTLAPVLGLVLTGYQLAADRYSYLSCLGWPLLAAPVLNRRRYGAAAVLILLGLMTWRQTGFWRDPETLWARALAVDAGSVIAHNNLGTALLAQKRVDEAIAHFEKAVALNPICVSAQDRLAAIFDEPARAAQAAALKETLKVNPACRQARGNMVTAKASLGRDLPEAAAYYRQLISLGYRAPGLYGNLGRVLLAQGMKSAADEAFRQERLAYPPPRGYTKATAEP